MPTRHSKSFTILGPPKGHTIECGSLPSLVSLVALDTQENLSRPWLGEQVRQAWDGAGVECGDTGSLSASVYQGRLTAILPRELCPAHLCPPLPELPCRGNITSALAPCPIPGLLDTISRVSNPAIDDHTPLCFLLCVGDLEPGVALSYMLYPEVVHLGTGVEGPGKEMWRLQGWELLCHHLPQSMGQWVEGGGVMTTGRVCQEQETAVPALPWAEDKRGDR